MGVKWYLGLLLDVIVELVEWFVFFVDGFMILYGFKGC